MQFNCIRGYYQKANGEDINVSFRMTYQDDDQSLEMDAVNAVHKEFSESVINKLPCRFHKKSQINLAFLHLNN